jgi:hypothetical protein
MDIGKDSSKTTSSHQRPGERGTRIERVQRGRIRFRTHAASSSLSTPAKL